MCFLNDYLQNEPEDSLLSKLYFDAAQLFLLGEKKKFPHNS